MAFTSRFLSSLSVPGFFLFFLVIASPSAAQYTAIDMRRYPGGIGAERSLSLRRRGLTVTPSPLPTDYFYAASVAIGTPPQNVSLVLDLFTDKTMIITPNSTFCNGN